MKLHKSVGEDRFLEDLTIVNDNIHTTHRRMELLSECDLLHTEELYRTLSTQNETVQWEDLDSLFTEHCRKRSDLPFSPLEGHGPALSMLSQSLGIAERIEFCRLIAAEHPKMPKDSAALISTLFGAAEPLPLAMRGLVAYQQNILTDEAYLRFAERLLRPRADYHTSFSSVCEQVYNGLCEYCILPLENSQDGKLLRFYSLIEKYELKILYTCDVTASDKRQTTTFGLCCRAINFPSPSLYSQEHEELRLEFIFRTDSESLSLCDVLSAAHACSLRLIRTDCLPRTDDEIMVGASYPFILSFDATSGDLRTFLVFLAADPSLCLPLGIYRHI